MSTTEVAKFDPATYVDKVRDKIKQSLVDVIPDEQWNVMLKAEISSFFENKTETGWNNQSTSKPSEFRRLAAVVLKEETKRRIREMLNGPDWSSCWDGTKQQAGEEIAKLARDNGAAILAKWLESAISQVISGLRSNQ